MGEQTQASKEATAEKTGSNEATGWTDISDDEQLPAQSEAPDRRPRTQSSDTTSPAVSELDCLSSTATELKESCEQMSANLEEFSEVLTETID